MEMAANGTLVPGLQNSAGPCRLLLEVVNRIGLVPNQIMRTIDRKLHKNNLPVLLSTLTQKHRAGRQVGHVLREFDGPHQAAGKVKDVR
ncbi:conserved hypothetical protein [Culex quinquefasciatus]|uniref:Uncharacterized protein n=1 Tax=Culex quinquefasciatus TaxID=7176 RepID=B0X9Z9_CULQU|nr:conserved hypothetical protein [Culex quinquefasciatus]|eukprot:XP_001866471.1 conserved hypothetical protein [Culex quinquefasciatus]